MGIVAAFRKLTTDEAAAVEGDLAKQPSVRQARGPRQRPDEGPLDLCREVIKLTGMAHQAEKERQEAMIRALKLEMQLRNAEAQRDHYRAAVERFWGYRRDHAAKKRAQKGRS